MIKKIHVFLFLLFCIFQAQAQEDNTIQLAILDTFYGGEKPLISTTSAYTQAYAQAAQTAMYNTKGYNIQPKLFIYGEGPIDILQSIPELNTWNPDLVIGSSSSDQFLLLRNYLPDKIVLSLYASDIHLKTLPKNFYSLLIPDDEIMRLLSEFIKEKFPKKNIYLIEQVDNKQSTDVAKLFISGYQKINPQVNITEKKMILDDIDAINSKALLADHEDDVIVIFNSTYFGYNLMVKHLSKDFPDKKLIFVSDQDNWGNEVDGNTYRFDLSYESYRIGPVLFDSSSSEFTAFDHAYRMLYHKKPDTALSFMTYVALMSVIEALHKYPCPDLSKNMREKILYSYEAALKENPNWFRKRAFGIYRLTSKGEVLVKRYPMSDLNHREKS